MEERGQDIVCNLICNVSMNIHSLQLTLAFIPLTQSRDWLKERAFYWARESPLSSLFSSLSVSGWWMRGDHYHKVRHHMVITLMMFSQGDQHRYIKASWGWLKCFLFLWAKLINVLQRADTATNSSSEGISASNNGWVTFTWLWFKVYLSIFGLYKTKMIKNYLAGIHLNRFDAKVTLADTCRKCT